MGEQHRRRGQTERRTAAGSTPRAKPGKVERAAMRAARSADLCWRWPLDAAGEPLPLDKLRDSVRNSNAATGRAPLATDSDVAAYLRHRCSDYDLIVARIGRFGAARQTLRARVAVAIAAQYPELGLAALDAAASESNRQRASTSKSLDYFGQNRSQHGV